MRKGMFVLLMIVALCCVARGVTLEEIIFGDGPTEAVRELEAITLPGVEDPISLLLGMQSGPDIDNKYNELSVNFAMRYRMLEIGPILYLWPGADDYDSCWGIYVIRHLSNEDLILGTPFLGFQTTLSSDSDGMYGFVAGFDKEVAENFYLRSTVGFRDFRDAMAFTHDEADEWMFNLGPIFCF